MEERLNSMQKSVDFTVAKNIEHDDRLNDLVRPTYSKVVTTSADIHHEQQPICGVGVAQFSLSNVHKRGLKRHHCISMSFCVDVIGAIVVSNKSSSSSVASRRAP